MTPRSPVWTRCAGCDYVWRVAYTPMALSDFGALLQTARCPNCAGKRLLLCDPPPGGIEPPPRDLPDY